MSDPPLTVTLQDVARHAGVSKMTVSNVINNKPGMSPATRERVQRAIDETGYVVNAAARVLAGGRMNLLGVITPRINWPFVTEILHGASSVVENAGLDLAIFTTADNPRVERERATLLRTLADGVLLIIPAADEHQVFGPTPVVTIAGDGPYTVSVDDEQGGRLAAQHLLSLGHTRIAHIRGAITTSRHDARDRERGFRTALQDAGVDLPDHLVRDGQYTEDGGERAARALLTLPEPPTAIFAANDRSAIGALHAAEALGVRVPEQLSIVGYDDVQIASLARPALTTIRQPLQAMGERAALTLLDLTRGVTPAQAHTRFPAALVVRDSTAPPVREVTVSP
ncbi:LacI family DNA-binding transcriptional regulator [Deinococcus maricopensis]|uniref:Transcriptional regulator, LacI family n=1 Tax=Deinococcus maricopensis (strain DSM 21211 / LMG 22137 / NRRL B-23946 / LB-34) TaxID=709986 RepID=E8U460_DEIML|nr:LacI family DNA-binding transcriptional regulator [Deinococcus maricopensis]ADV65897.1 transcriptional regulator, LacI family [Deinococcus maricopensis DSM 21211]